MQIPLDYYRILGLPVAASHEQLQQAYRDRLQQLPRREYSPAAIAARKQLIEQAYAVLSDPIQRKTYDTNYFAHRYEQQPTLKDTENSEYLVEDIFAPHTPIIEIADNLFAGALLILQELGEYELVLTLGNSYLNHSYRENDDQLRADVVLTVALAYLELGREQWQQGNYESAANSLQNGEQQLTREGMFLNIRNDIAADLNKLRPYRILALLAEPEGTSLERRRLGLKLLQDILDARGGIDGASDDGSGLSLDDFLRFIQQLRTYLSISEQQTLFEAESKRPSAVANYLAVYALIARGFTQRMPVLISQAKQLLQYLAKTKRQDVYLEHAIATLLLGQTIEANRALELSQEHEPLEFIREHSQGSPDLLPGLCLYAERWLQNEVFPQFRDLKHQQASLKEYFADEHVQTYLEALPNQSDTSQTVATVATSTTHTASQPQRQKSNRTRKTTANTAVHTTKDGTTTANKARSVTLEPTTVQTTSMQQKGGLTVAQTSAMQHVRVPQRKRRKRKAFAVKDKTMIALLALAGLVGSVFVFALLGQAFGWLRQTLYPAPPPLPGEQLAVQLNQPLLAIPSPGSQFLPVVEPLDAATAEQVIQSWLSAKAAAFSTDYAIEGLQNILVDPALAQWQQRVRSDRANNRHRQFQHNLKIDSLQVNATNPDLATVQATVSEIAQIYDQGKLNQRASYADENLRVRYDLVRSNSAWRIRQMQVLN